MIEAYCDNPDATPIYVIARDDWNDWLEQQNEFTRNWVETNGYKAKAGNYLSIPDAEGRITCVVVGRLKTGSLYQLGGLPANLPVQQYRLANPADDESVALAMYLGWGLACYQFTRYKKAAAEAMPQLHLPDQYSAEVQHLLTAQCQVRDWVNTPTDDLGPSEFEQIATQLAANLNFQVSAIHGDALLEQGYPAIHAVGRASDDAPRLLTLHWQNPGKPKVALVGKGVCFDTGGLNIKSALGMLKMKKDMGGAAHVLALAGLIAEQQLPIDLQVYLPLVENAIAGNAYRPGDVVATRKGLSVEIGNTDAEGRVILSDALTKASEDGAELIIDYATLTGAARVALGTDLPPVFSNRAEVARDLQSCSEQVEDPLWMLPLYQPYKKSLKSKIADLNNISGSSFGGCIVAALFLEHFVAEDIPWVHIDTYAWNDRQRPGRPPGGEALGLRAVFAYLKQRYPDA